MKLFFNGEITVPDGVSKHDVEQWMRFEMGLSAELSGANAMAMTDLVTHGVDYLAVRFTSPEL